MREVESTSPPSGHVLLVDCMVNTRLFLRDDGFRGLVEPLRAAGVQVELIDLVRDEPPPGKAMRDALEAIRAAEATVVVVSRAWDAAMVDALRQAAGSKAHLVRHSHGAPSPIDESFDAVLDAGGILGWIHGHHDVPAPAWRRTRGELRELRPLLIPRADAAQPTISGPARGCPFLVDVRTSPAYRGSGIDFDRVQSKGCAFCLDNVGAFATFPADVVVSSWLEQLRALRSERPEVREVLLTDERPHPYLPALFQAILAEPALHGIELLMKTRVDWLAEFADSALREACDLAEQSASVVHIYLVGFESFHQADLDLFNKAVAVADNERAIEILRMLAERHPRSFEYRAKRAHGIVLFHPWSTPESLLDNARAMRDLQFHELRSQALRTRLRLYASVPLHALAVEQGLLVDHFEDGRGDRAVEQGYDASIPWRFGDARVEAIFRAANRVADAMPGLLEADVLEMVTRFVVRWPVFAEAPDLAALPLLQAPWSWNGSPENVVATLGAAIAGFDREVEAVAVGDKPACLKESVPRQDVDDLVRAYARMGLAAAEVSTHERGGDDGLHTRGSSHSIVAVARNEATLKSVVEHQRAVESGDATHIPLMGELMGYPSCCVEAFRAKRHHGDNLDLERAPLRAHPERPLEPLVNRFAAVSLVSHMLCSPNCTESTQIARKRLAMVEAFDTRSADRIVQHLALPVLRLDYRRAAAVTGVWESDRFRVHTLRPFCDANLGVDPELVEAIQLGPEQVELVLKGGAVRSLSASAPVLIEPGKALAPSVRRAMDRQASRAPVPEPRVPLAGGERESSPSPVLESLLPILAPKTQVGDFSVVETTTDGQGGYVVVLGGDARSLQVQVRPWISTRPAMSRRGAWALDLTEGSVPSSSDRTLLGVLARLLPAGNHQEGSSTQPTPSASTRPLKVNNLAVGAGVICTTPWTTLEVVDPDGRVRQCCGDWTVGDRGNLHQSPLVDVWNGAGYRMARRVMSGTALTDLCHAICPRLYDAKFAERELMLIPGAEAFEANQNALFEDIAARREVVRGKPLYIAVCPSTYCNYDCIMCLHGRSPRRDLPDSIWDDLLGMLPTLHVLTLLGGEPLANPLAMKFLRAWDRDKYPDASVSLVTNGSLLTRSVLPQLERCRFGSVTVSLNAGTADVYAAVQRGIELDDVLANIDSLIEFRRLHEMRFPIVLSFVVQPANRSTMIAFAELARVRGLPIRLMPLSPRGPEGLDFYEDEDEVARILESLDQMSAWAMSAAPSFSQEILGTRSAIAAEAAGRRSQRPADSSRPTVTPIVSAGSS